LLGSPAANSLLDQQDTVDRAVREVPLAAWAAFGGEQVLFLVVRQRPDADARLGGEIADAHHASPL
jgi:hypothetical protein